MNITKLKLAIAGIALVFILTGMVGAVSARDDCGDHQCAPGEVYHDAMYGACQSCPTVQVDTSHWGTCQNCPYVDAAYGPWGSWQDGTCHGGESNTCEEQCANGEGSGCSHGKHSEYRTRTYTPGHYTCHTGDPNYRHDSCSSHQEQHWIVSSELQQVCHDHPHNPGVGDYVSCDCHGRGCDHDVEYEKQIISLAGCVAVSCPAIPCNPGYQCNNGGCSPIPNTCPDLVGSIWTWTFDGGYIHTMLIDSYDLGTGAITGHGFYDVDPSYTWTMTGTLLGNDIAFHILYTGMNSGYFVDATGSFDGCEFISGPASQNGGLPTDSWTAVPKVCPSGYTLNTDSGLCVANPSESSGVLPACYQQDVFQNTQLAPSCQGLGTLPTIPLISLDGEPLYISVTHDGPFSVQKVAHDGEPELLYNTDCTAVNYFKNSCNLERLCSGGGTLTFIDKGTRDFTIAARPNFNGDPRPFQITVTDHFVHFSKTTDGPTLDLHFARTMDTSSCRYWENGILIFTGIPQF